MTLKIQILNTNRNVVKEKKVSRQWKKKFEINTEKKNVEEIKVYYTLIKYSISVQTLMKFNNYSTH